MDYKLLLLVMWFPLRNLSSSSRDIVGCNFKIIANISIAIDCAENMNIDAIPNITNMEKPVISLNMSGCKKLTSIQPGAFTSYIHLLSLDLSRTSLILPEETTGLFTGLEKLEMLNIAHNERFPITNATKIKTLLEPLIHLKELIIHGTTGTYQTKGFPNSAFLQLPLLNTVVADARDGIIFGPAFQILVNLTNLFIAGDRIIPPWRSPEFCKMEKVTSETLQNLIYVQRLSIRKCGIKHIAKDAFVNMTCLQVLDLSFNNKLRVHNAFDFFPSLSPCVGTVILDQIEDVLHMDCSISITSDMMSKLKGKNVKNLHLVDNRVAYIEKKAFKEMPPSLSYVNLSRNKLQPGFYMFYSYIAKHLKTLDISYNSFPEEMWQRSYRDLNENSLRALKRLKHGHQQEENFSFRAEDSEELIQFQDSVAFKTVCRSQPNFGVPPGVITIYLPKELETVNISYSKIAMPIIELNADSNNSIKTVEARKCMLYCWEGPVYGLEKLKNLDLSWNDCMYANYSFFSAFKNITRLDISLNLLFQTIENTKSGVLLKYNTELRFLDLTLNHIRSIPYDFFKHQAKLEFLNISDNHLRELNFTIIHMERLQLLDLSHNHIVTIHSDMLRELQHIRKSNRTKILRVDLRENDLECSCDNLDFFRIVFNNGSSQSLSIDINRCLTHDLENKPVCLKCREDLEALILSLEKRCENYSAIIIFSSVVIILFINVIVGFIVHRNRWKLCYWFYVVNRQKGTSQTGFRFFETSMRSLSERFRYDVFFAYAEEKQTFAVTSVRGRLMSLKPDCKIFLQHADSVPGQNLMQYFGNIIHASRVVVFIISKDCWKHSADWTVALHMAHVESLYRKKAMFIGVLLGNDVSEVVLPGNIVEMSRRRQLLRYPQDENNEELINQFWDNFTEALDNFKQQTTPNL